MYTMKIKTDTRMGLLTIYLIIFRGEKVMYDVAHIGIVVKDINGSLPFYQEVLRCELRVISQEGNLKFALLKCGNQMIELLQYLDHQEERVAGVIDHIALKVHDMEKEVLRLKEKGVKLLFDAPKIVSGGKKIMFFKGPDGESFEFIN